MATCERFEGTTRVEEKSNVRERSGEEAWSLMLVDPALVLARDELARAQHVYSRVISTPIPPKVWAKRGGPMSRGQRRASRRRHDFRVNDARAFAAQQTACKRLIAAEEAWKEAHGRLTLVRHDLPAGPGSARRWIWEW